MGVSTGIGKGHLSVNINNTNIVSQYANMAFKKEYYQGWLLCDGRCVSKEEYSELYQIIGDSFDYSDGTNNDHHDDTRFMLPDLLCVVIGGCGQNVDGLTDRNIGDWTGSETHSLSVDELASHSHTFRYHGESGSGWNAGAFQLTDRNPMHTGSGEMYSTGNNKPFNIMQPTVFPGYWYIYSGV